MCGDPDLTKSGREFWKLKRYHHRPRISILIRWDSHLLFLTTKDVAAVITDDTYEIQIDRTSSSSFLALPNSSLDLHGGSQHKTLLRLIHIAQGETYRDSPTRVARANRPHQLIVH